MNAEHASGLRIGLKGFRDEPWIEGFFPNDLPEEWRLSYYANEFCALTINARDWMALDAADVEEWLEERGTRFELLLLNADAAGLDRAALLGRLDVSAVRARCVEGSDGGFWMPDTACDPAVRDALVFADEALTTRRLRSRMESFGRHLNGRSGRLFFHGPDAVRAAREAKVLAGLLGY